MTPCEEVAAVWTVPSAASPGCILGDNGSGGFGANKRKGNVSCMNPSMLRQGGKLGATSCFV